MSLAVIVLAAGLGTRMKSETPKVLHPLLANRSSTMFSMQSPAESGKNIVVVNPQGETVRTALAGRISHSPSRRR